MDTGETHYFGDTHVTINRSNYNYTAASSTSVKANGMTFTLESENVLRSGAQRFFRDGGATRSFSVRIAGVPVRRRNPNNQSDSEEGASSAEGEASFDQAVAGDPQTISVGFESPSVPQSTEANVHPQDDGEFVGTIPLVEAGHNSKTSYRIASNAIRGYMYGNGFADYEVVLNFANIGNSNAFMSMWEIELPAGLTTTSSLSGNFSTLAPGDSDQIPIILTAGPITGDYEEKQLVIRIQDSETERTWEDYVVLRLYRLPISIRIRGYNLDRNTRAALKTFVVAPDNRSHFAQIQHNTTGSITVPYRNEGYIMAFSGAGHDSEMKYSFTTGGTPPTIVGPETWTIEQINRFRNYNTENNAYGITTPSQPTDAYLGVGDVQFFRLDLSELAESRYQAFQYNAHILGDPEGIADGIPNPGETMSMDMRIQNVSRFTRDVTATLDSSSSYITFPKPSFHYRVISSGGYQTIRNRDNGGGSTTWNGVTMNASSRSAFSFTILESTPS